MNPKIDASPISPDLGFCEEKNRLLGEYVRAMRQVVALQNQQTRAVIGGDLDFARFDVLLHMANEAREEAKYALLSHIDAHRCGDGYAR